jgi:hypothetical protein
MSGDDSPGLIARLRAWLGSLVDTGDGETTATGDESTAAGAAETAAEATPAPYLCNVCGTDVADPASGCPLCNSSDVRERGAAPDEPSSTPSPQATASESTVDGEAARLRELQDDAVDSSPEGDGSDATDATDTAVDGDTDGTTGEIE